MSLPTVTENGTATRWYTLAAVALLFVVALATAAGWRLYPLFIDTYYHMGVIEGFSQAGGITTRAFWELAPGGRVHIYPPALHAIGCFFALAGVSPRIYITFVSAVCYAGCLLTTWLWLRRISGPRGALFAVVFLCGPYAFFWTQASFTAVAGVMVLAPLALLALETEHLLACAVLNFVALTMHPIGLFLPLALVINTLVRKKKRRAGLLAAIVPVLLYGPWLVHIWANRALLPDSRTGGEISVGGFGVGGLNLGVFLIVLSALAVPWLLVRRGPALGLIGALLGFAVVFPMGFGGRFLAFNIHWPLACLAGYGLGELVRWLEQFTWSRAGVQVLSIVLVGTALVAYPALEMPLPKSEGPPGPPPTRTAEPGDLSKGEPTRAETRSALADLRFTAQAGALPKLFDAYSGGSSGGGMGPPGAGRPNAGLPMGAPPQMGPGRPVGQTRPAGRAAGPPGGGGGPGVDMLRRAGAEDFFTALQTNAQVGDVIHVNDAAAGSMLVGVTGRWTSSGILRDVRSETDRARPEACDFMAVLAGGMGPGPGGPMGTQSPPASFEKVFENQYGALYRNPATPEHVRQPPKPDVDLRLLTVIASVGLLLLAIDFLPARCVQTRRFAGGLAVIVVALCFVPLSITALGELRHPPAAPPAGRDGGPGFGPPGFDPGQFLAETFQREMDPNQRGAISRADFGALAGRWFDSWDANRRGDLTLEDVAAGLRSLLGRPSDAGDPPPPDAPPGWRPEAFVAQRMFSAGDTDGDGKLTRAELVRAFENWFREWDENSQGALEAATVARRLERLLGPPAPSGESVSAASATQPVSGIP